MPPCYTPTGSVTFAGLLFAMVMVGTFPAGSAQGGETDRVTAARHHVGPALERDLSAVGLRLGSPVFIRIFKEARVLELWMLRHDTAKYQLFRSWPIVKMSGRLGPKLAEGDMQTPEGFYAVSQRQMNPRSTYHLAFNIGFPNAYDRSHNHSGSYIMVHGNKVSIGCFAMTDEKIEEIYTLCDAALRGGQPFFRVHIFPFRMTRERMERAKGGEWLAFWMNLREGYDRFERDHIPPETGLGGGKYVFR